MRLQRRIQPFAAFPGAMRQASRPATAPAPRPDGQAVHASRLAMFRLDARLAWIGGGGAATAASWLGACHGERLEPVSAVTRAALLAAVRRLGQDPGRSSPIPVYDAMAQLAAFATARPGPDRGFVLTVRMLQPAETPPLDEPLRRTFDFTVAEAALGAALHRHGDLQQAAAALGVTEGTARTRLQAIFEKTDTHRQVDLLRMLDALADALAD
jgi:hypothetical protein